MQPHSGTRHWFFLILFWAWCNAPTSTSTFISVHFHNVLSLRLMFKVWLIIMKHPRMAAFKWQCIQEIWPEDYDNEQRSPGPSQRAWARGGLQRRIGSKINLPHLFKTSERRQKRWVSGTLPSHACVEEQFRGACTRFPQCKPDFHTCFMHILRSQMFVRLSVCACSYAAPIFER